MMRFPQACRRLSAVAALGLLACSVQATTLDPATPEEVQGGRDLDERLTVPVTINGGGPYHFVVDTGSERTVLSRELADRLTLAPASNVTLLSLTGLEEVRTAMVPELRLTASRKGMADFAAPLLSQNHMGAAGILGIDSLQTKRVVMDFRAMRMSISDAPRAAPIDNDEIVVSARRRLGQLILVDAEANGQKISVIIDTGSAVTIGNPALHKKLAARGRLGRSMPISITSVTGGDIPADYTQVDRVRIGGVTLVDMPVAFADPQVFRRLGLTSKPALLLGMDVLRLFDRVSIDFANRNVRFILKGDALQAAPLLAASAVVRGG
jgi:predicted aspartyl protease